MFQRHLLLIRRFAEFGQIGGPFVLGNNRPGPLPAVSASIGYFPVFIGIRDQKNVPRDIFSFRIPFFNFNGLDLIRRHCGRRAQSGSVFHDFPAGNPSRKNVRGHDCSSGMRGHADANRQPRSNFAVLIESTFRCVEARVHLQADFLFLFVSETADFFLIRQKKGAVF